ncbi:MAG TPA: hypothetical protein VFW71_11360 [Actinomycetota bacterium]|nr:hypothetical protein [Actinomycetota bacterium]
MRAFLNKQRLLVVTAVIGALGAGVALGFLLGVPGLSSAEPAPAASRLPGPRRAAGLEIPSLAVAAKAIGVSATILAQDLRSGQSIAEVARSKNVAVQKVIDALTTAATARIETALKNGRITDAQATTLKADLASRITAFVNQTGLRFRFPGVTGTAAPHGRFGPPTSTVVPFRGPLGGLGVRSIGAAAKAIGVSPTVVVQALRAGRSIADVAQSHNVPPQSVIHTLTTEATNRIDAAANAGKITAAQAASLKAKLSSEVTTFVNQKGLGGIVPGPFGRFGGKAPGGGPGPGPAVPPSFQL